MESDDELDDERSSGPLLPPDDRLWRHPSELALAGSRHGGRTAALVGTPRRPGRTPGRVAARDDGRLWTIAVLSAVVGALLATGALYATGDMRTKHVTIAALERNVDSSPTVTAGPGSAAFVLAAESVRPSCVVLVASGAHGTRVANGVVFRSDGMLLTSAAAISGAQSIVATVGGTHRVTARVVAVDPGTGLAVVKLTGSSFEPATLGSALGIRVGDPVIAVHPPSHAANDVPGDQGAIAGLGRTVVAGGVRVPDLMEVDRTGTPGALGGPVVDAHGVVVGIATASGASGRAVDYATPIDLAREVASQLLATRHVVHVWLGVQGRDLPAGTAVSMGVAGGAVISGVLAGSPAAAAGLLAGDVVVAIDDKAVTSMANLIVAAHAQAPGTRVELDIERGGRSRTATVQITPRPANAAA